MGKRNTVLISSSDDEEGKQPRWSSTAKRIAKSNPRSSSKRGTKSEAPKKKPRMVESRRKSEASHFDQMQFFCEDFDEGFNGFKVPTDSIRNGQKELWVDKYKPRTLDDLAVHKKKVEEVKLWFQERLRSPKDSLQNQVLVVTGQTGVGKSATIHVIASLFGAKIFEWTTPTPTLWQEYTHSSSSGMSYISKLDEFENFIERIRKFGSISLLEGQSNSHGILMIDDLPVANGKVASRKLQNCLQLLVRTSCMPTAIVITDCSRGDSQDSNGRWLEELQMSLESAGACKVSFNPVTPNAIKKVLSRICRLEHCNLTNEQIDLIAKFSGGDIRHAISSLQYLSLKRDSDYRRESILNHSSAFENEKSDKGNNNCFLPMGRDETLSLFHALGKFLHNKRETEATLILDQDPFVLNEKFARLPLKMDAPEKILSQAHGQARPITDFLHENVLDFMNDEAIDDSWIVATYLSDVDILLASLNGAMFRNHVAENLGQSVAASVASRGVLFGNCRPASSRWHSIRRPKLWQVEQSSLQNKCGLLKLRFDNQDACSLFNSMVTSIELRPALKWLGYRESSSPKMQVLDSGETESDAMSIDENDELEDEIEDW